MARYTFAVCIRCGVQSPPVILETETVTEKLKQMGWRVDEGRFVVRAICPSCQETEQLA